MSRKSKRPVEAARAEEGIFWWGRIGARGPWIAAAFVILATVRIAATYPVFNHTIDEPAHIACGMEWLSKGTYNYEALHPPLARVASALGPFLDGARSAGRPDKYMEGAAVLYGGDGSAYDRRLMLSRAGMLPFFWLACAVVYVWCARWFDQETAVVATFLFTFLPGILAHAGLATTDMALTATLGAALLALIRMVERPSAMTGAALGLFGGLAILSKLTALPFFAASGVAAGLVGLALLRPAWRSCLRLAVPLLIGVSVTAAVVWAGYRFSWGPTPYTRVSLPAPELFGGISQVLNYTGRGHPSYLFGELSKSGFWYYYPVALAVKTPLPFLVLTAAGVWVAVKNRETKYWIPLAFAAGLLGFALTSTVNIGTRHVMPLYLFFAILSAAAVRKLARSSSNWIRKAVAAMVLWMAATSALSHPDYLAYFNALAGDEPERILVDSDLDWGQDMKRLAARLQQVGARQVYFNPLMVGHLEAVHGFPPITPVNPVEPEPGWTAVSITVLKSTRLGLYDEAPEVDPWPNRIKPMERVGKGVYLYHFAARRPAGAR